MGFTAVQSHSSRAGTRILTKLGQTSCSKQHQLQLALCNILSLFLGTADHLWRRATEVTINITQKITSTICQNVSITYERLTGLAFRTHQRTICFSSESSLILWSAIDKFNIHNEICRLYFARKTLRTITIVASCTYRDSYIFFLLPVVLCVSLDYFGEFWRSVIEIYAFSLIKWD